jgi:hypothetical protein
VVVLLAGIAGFVVAFLLMAWWGRRAVRGLDPGLLPRFPSLPKPPT